MAGLIDFEIMDRTVDILRSARGIGIPEEEVYNLVLGLKRPPIDPRASDVAYTLGMLRASNGILTVEREGVQRLVLNPAIYSAGRKDSA